MGHMSKCTRQTTAANTHCAQTEHKCEAFLLPSGLVPVRTRIFTHTMWGLCESLGEKTALASALRPYCRLSAFLSHPGTLNKLHKQAGTPPPRGPSLSLTHTRTQKARGGAGCRGARFLLGGADSCGESAWQERGGLKEMKDAKIKTNKHKIRNRKRKEERKN